MKPLQTLQTLLRREYWENRGNFAIVPIAIGGFVIAMLIFALFNTEHFANMYGSEMMNSNGISISGMDLLGSLSIEFANLPLERRTTIWSMGLYGISTQFTFVLILVSIIYLLGSLYDDRKDRSILFWKSLPVSDLMTVTSKIVTVLLVIPALYAIATILTFILMMFVLSIVAMFSGGDIWASIWQPAPFITLPIKIFFKHVIQSLWAAPFLAWLLLVSSWTKRKPILMATIPIGVITFLEFYYNRSNEFISLIRERAVGWVLPINLENGTQIKNGRQFFEQKIINFDALSLLSLPEFWYGIIFSAFLFGGAVYIRRYRDES